MGRIPIHLHLLVFWQHRYGKHKAGGLQPGYVAFPAAGGRMARLSTEDIRARRSHRLRVPEAMPSMLQPNSSSVAGSGTVALLPR